MKFIRVIKSRWGYDKEEPTSYSEAVIKELEDTSTDLGESFFQYNAYSLNIYCYFDMEPWKEILSSRCIKLLNPLVDNLLSNMNSSGWPNSSETYNILDIAFEERVEVSDFKNPANGNDLYKFVKDTSKILKEESNNIINDLNEVPDYENRLKKQKTISELKKWFNDINTTISKMVYILENEYGK